MPNDESPQREVRFSRQFKRDLKRLAKRYRRVKSDIQTIFDKLENGEKVGDQIQGTDFEVYKVRAKNTDANKGKSGGYRLIYYIQIEDMIIMITMYSKSDQSDISSEEIVRLIDEANGELE